ncbi:MAG: urease accessory protein UreD [Ferruginibacter sp.]
MIASLHIKTRLKQQVTVLENVFCTTPFKVANITENKKLKELQLMLMSSSPGILDGDVYQMKIELGAGSQLNLHTQSYQRLFNMKQSATQNLEVLLADSSSFCYLPHPAVPHKSSDFTAINKIYLSANCRLIFGEILTCGRKLNGEVFSFSKYHNITEVFINNKLIIRENLLIQPATINLQAIGQLEGFTHQASLIFLCENFNLKEASTLIDNYLAEEKDLVYGITETPVSGLLVRLLGQGAEQLHDCLKAIAATLTSVTNHQTVTYVE